MLTDACASQTDCCESLTDAYEEVTDAREEQTNTCEDPTNTREEQTNACEDPTNTCEDPTNACEEVTNTCEEPTDAREALTDTFEALSNAYKAFQKHLSALHKENAAAGGNQSDPGTERTAAGAKDAALRACYRGVKDSLIGFGIDKACPVINNFTQLMSEAAAAAVCLLLRTNSYMKQYLFILIVILCSAPAALAQPAAAAKAVAAGNVYQSFVAALEEGNTAIDYAVFRKSFAESGLMTQKKDSLQYYDSLAAEMVSQAKSNRYFEVIRLAKRMLAMDYTSLQAHQYLKKMYTEMKDSARALRHRDIHLGLLKSIIGTGDGRSCGGGWVVMQPEEAKFILMMGGFTVKDEQREPAGRYECLKYKVIGKDGAEAVQYFRLFSPLKQFPRN